MNGKNALSMGRGWGVCEQERAAGHCYMHTTVTCTPHRCPHRVHGAPNHGGGAVVCPLRKRGGRALTREHASTAHGGASVPLHTRATARVRRTCTATHAAAGQVVH